MQTAIRAWLFAGSLFQQEPDDTHERLGVKRYELLHTILNVPNRAAKAAEKDIRGSIKSGAESKLSMLSENSQSKYESLTVLPRLTRF